MNNLPQNTAIPESDSYSPRKKLVQWQVLFDNFSFENRHELSGQANIKHLDEIFTLK